MTRIQTKSVLLAIYNHPDQFPPTRNAIHLLAREFEKIFVVFRPNSLNSNDFPSNVVESRWSQMEPTNPSLINKILQFIRFIRKMKRIVATENPGLIIVYDNLALYGMYWVLKWTKTKAMVWYHNHDVPQMDLIRKYSIGWFASKVDKDIFPRLNIFSVPTEERATQFPLHLLKAKPLVIPNYPLTSLLKITDVKEKDSQLIKVIFQGRVTRNRGIEEMLAYMASSKKMMLLTLKGPMDESFKDDLEELVSKYQVEDRVVIKGVGPYQEVAIETSKHHIGLAGIKPVGVNYQSAGTASNKIYEYASCGLPVIYFDTGHYRKYLDPYEWAFSSDLSTESLDTTISEIMRSYTELSALAIKDFREDLNYEVVFLPVIADVKNSLKSSFDKHEG